MKTPFDAESVVLPAAITKHNPNDPADQRARRLLKREETIAKYHFEKIIGTRRKNGVRNKKKLKPRDRHVISCYVMGMRLVDVAEQFDLSLAQVINILQDPLSQQYLESFDQAHRDELGAMLPLVNDAVRDALESPGIDTKLKGVDRWTKVQRVVNGDAGNVEASQKTEEIRAARFRFIDQIKSIAAQEGVIEAEAVIVEAAE